MRSAAKMCARAARLLSKIFNRRFPPYVSPTNSLGESRASGGRLMWSASRSRLVYRAIDFARSIAQKKPRRYAFQLSPQRKLYLQTAYVVCAALRSFVSARLHSRRDVKLPIPLSLVDPVPFWLTHFLHSCNISLLTDIFLIKYELVKLSLPITPDTFLIKRELVKVLSIFGGDPDCKPGNEPAVESNIGYGFRVTY